MPGAGDGEQAAAEKKEWDGEEQEARHAGRSRGDDGGFRHSASGRNCDQDPGQEAVGKRGAEEETGAGGECGDRARQEAGDEVGLREDEGDCRAGDKRQDAMKSLPLGDAQQEEHGKKEKAARRERPEPQIFRQAKRRRDRAYRRRRLGPSPGEKEARDRTHGIGADGCHAPPARRQEPGDDIEAKGKRAPQRQRQARADKREEEPESGLFRAGKAGRGAVAERDRDEDEKQEHCEENARRSREHACNPQREPGRDGRRCRPVFRSEQGGLGRVPAGTVAGRHPRHPPISMAISATGGAFSISPLSTRKAPKRA